MAHQDRLDRDLAARRQVLVDGREVAGPELLADRLDHLDGDDRVVLALDVAVVADLDLGEVVEPTLLDPLGAELGLLPGQRDRRDGGAAFGGPDRERAPAAADLEHAGATTDPGIVEDAVDLAELGRFESPRRSR